MEIQPYAFIAYGRRMGKDDWACPHDLGFYASSDDILQTHAQSTHHLYGRSHCHYKQQTIDTVSTDPVDTFILTPATLLTQKTGASSVPPGDFVKPDLYKQQWRMVQSLASTFWDRWHKQYLATLQHRRKWQHQQPNISKGCIVLFKDSQSKWNDWPLGIITETYPSQDGKVRKVQVKIIGKD